MAKPPSEINGTTMASNTELWEDYQKNIAERDTLSEEEALFVLGVLEQLNNPTSKELTDHFKSKINSNNAKIIEAWNKLQRASNPKLLENYRQNHEEIDILADEKLLFILRFVQQLDTPTLKELADYLSWTLEETVADCIKLQNAGLIKIKDANNPDSHIELLQKGERLLELVEATAQSSESEVSGESSEEEEEEPEYDESKTIHELAIKAAGGDREALQKLFEHSYFRRRLKRICMWLAKRHKLDPSELEDEAYKKILMNIGKFGAKASFETWFSTLVRRLHIDMLRKQIRHDRYVQAQKDVLLRDEALRAGREEEIIVDKIALKEAMRTLLPVERRIIELSRAGYNIEEISKRVNLSTSHTHRVWKRAMQRLMVVVSSAGN